jgi:hypothetical protein
LNRKACWYVYQDLGNKLFVFQAYPGKTDELRATEILQEHGLRLHIFRRPDNTAVFWQREGFCCLLISDADPSEVIDLARTNASS